MLKQQAKLFRNISIFMDTATISAAFVCAYHLRNITGDLEIITDYLWNLLIILPIWYFFFNKFGLYASLRTYGYGQIISAVVKVHAAGTLVTTSVFYLFRPGGVSRLLFIYFILLSLLLISSEKILFKLFLNVIRKKGRNFRNILIVGTDDKARALVRLIEQHVYWGFRIVGFLQHGSPSGTDKVDGYDLVGSLEDLIEVCKANAVDEVVFCLPKEELPAFEEDLRLLEDMGITVRMVLDDFTFRSHRIELSYIHDQLPILTVYPKPFDAGQLVLKRVLDIVGALVGLSIAALLYPFIAVAIKLDSRGPVFFIQKRVGENGRQFDCWKFRTMYLDAEARKKDLLRFNEMKGAIFKISNDPRITPVGRFLRTFSMDELPQFWNVLRGEMSLVGTRPPTPDEVKGYDNWHRKRISIKPGITGLWQVSGRNEIRDFDEVVRLDLKYIEQWSFWLDVKILFRTVWVVITRQGSC